MLKFPAMLAVLALSLTRALAQETAPTTPTLALELNALQAADTGCRVTFLATNTLGAAVDRAGIEIAFFAGDGAIDRIVTLDFKGLTEGKTKVLQFQLNDLACDDISRLLVNDITACEGAGLAPAACLDGLVTTTRPDIVFGV